MNIHHQHHAIRFTLSVCAAAALLNPLQAQSYPATTGTSTGTAFTEADREFVVEAALLGHEEIALSQLALTRASNADVRQYTQKIIDDHASANTKLVQLASAKGVVLSSLTSAHPGSSQRMGSSSSGASASNPATTSSDPGSGATDASTRPATIYANDPAVSAEIAKDVSAGMNRIREKEANLAKKTGQDFDEAYLEVMMKGHSKAIDLFRSTAARKETDSELAAFASSTLETLRGHHRQAEELEKVIDS